MRRAVYRGASGYTCYRSACMRRAASLSVIRRVAAPHAAGNARRHEWIMPAAGVVACGGVTVIDLTYPCAGWIITL